MSHYQRYIAEAIGVQDQPTLALVEELMRTDRTGLDGLDPKAFAALALQSLSDARGLHYDGQLAFYCGALGLDLPAWAS